MEDMLPEWAYTESELDEIARDVIEPITMCGKKHIAIYNMYKDSKYTGIVMILAVASISDGVHAINRMWSGAGLYAEAAEFTEEATEGNAYKIKHIELVLDKHKYIPKIKNIGWNKMYIGKTWYKELI